MYGNAKADSSSYHDLRQHSGVVDFAAAKTQLTLPSSALAALGANGSSESKWSSLPASSRNRAAWR